MIVVIGPHGSFQVALPLHLASKLANCGLGVHLDEKAQSGSDYLLLRPRSGEAHGLLNELVVRFNSGQHDQCWPRLFRDSLAAALTCGTMTGSYELPGPRSRDRGFVI